MDLIKTMIKQAKAAGYKPKALWRAGDQYYLTTQDIDLSKHAKLIKRYK